MDSLELYSAIESGRRPAILDVRNPDEFARWKIEGPGRSDSLNLPYFDFIDREADSVSKAREWKSAHPGGLVVVCAKGDSSAYVAEVLRAAGVPASNLEGGMAAWGRASTTRPLDTGSSVRAWQFLRFGKGCLSYLVAADDDAIVVDPHRRIEVYRRAVADFGLKLSGVIDTHLHADHRSGGRALARAERVPYYANPLDFGAAAFDFASVHDRSLLFLGENGVPFRFLAAPGHTPGGTMLLVDGRLLFTGDTLFVGSVGRPDLGGRAREWAEDLHETLFERLKTIDGSARVLPAHTSGPAELRADGTAWETLAILRGRLPLMRLPKNLFIEAVLDGLAPAPPGYETIRRLNLELEGASDDELSELELGKNECALARKE